MKRLTKALVATLVLCFAAVVYASPINCSLTPSAPACAPTLSMTIQVGDGPAQTISTAGTAVFSSGTWNVELAPQSIQGFSFTGGVLQANSDPFVGFSFGATNLTSSTVTVTFDYTTAYTGGSYGLVQSVYGDVLIDTNFTGQSTMSPVGSADILNTYDTGNLISAVGIGHGCTTPLHVFFCTSPDSGSIGPLPYTSFASGTLEVKGAFTVTRGAQYSLTGRSALLPIPEPGTLVLLGSGLIGLAGFARRRLSK